MLLQTRDRNYQPLNSFKYMDNMGTGPQTAERESRVGPIAGIIIVIAVLIIGGLYFWGAKLNEKTTEPNEVAEAPDTQAAALLEQSASDEISDIEKDLGTTNLENLDAELQTELEL